MSAAASTMTDSDVLRAILADMVQLKGDIGQLKGDVGRIHGDVGQLNIKVSALTGEMVGEKDRLAALERYGSYK